jgi:hypothetical protein
MKTLKTLDNPIETMAVISGIGACVLMNLAVLVAFII